MRFKAVCVLALGMAASGLASASDLLINFPDTTPVSRTASAPVLCKVVVQNYEFDSTLLGAGNASSTCTASNLFPANAPGYLAVGKYGTSPAVGGYVNLVPPVGVSFDLLSLRINDYGVGNDLTVYGTDSSGASIVYPLSTVAGVADYAIPASSGLRNLSAATIASANNRFDLTHVQLHDSATPLPVSYADTWTGNGYGGRDLSNEGSSTAGKATIQLLPDPARFTGTVTGGSIVYLLPSGERLTIDNPTWTFKPQYPRLLGKSAVSTLTATGTGVDAKGYPVTVNIREELRTYFQGLAWHYGALSGRIEVKY
ncbi:hypothetical protein SAMN04488038_11417 [Solimonas aquatica]|uniref:Uncharacterized protein n=1 Tax=Solimonas aquatica TaxID=489703 RepID=A0A1H9KSD5_9GAMM|nr:hypothetical protein [Solimonas aquatica]SER01949.1 hypothetical protein SAMN04488038_11417 [Solimonas aquatica]